MMTMLGKIVMDAMQTTKQNKKGMAALAIRWLSLPVMLIPSLHWRRHASCVDADAKKPPVGGFLVAVDFVLKSQR